MTNDDLNNMSTEELTALFSERALYAAVMMTGAPAYIIDDYEIRGNLESDHVYHIDNFRNALTAPSSHFLEPIPDVKTPVIFLYKENTKKITDAYNVLKNAGVKVFFQDANKPFKTIKCTDANEIKKELEKQYQANYSAGGTIDEFKDIVNSNANTPPIKTGFDMLDKCLDGGLYEGLHAIGAISSLGKTTFCLNIAEQIAAGGNDVIIIALEMSKYALIGRSISRITFVKYQEHPSKYDYSWCKTSRGITDGSRYSNYSQDEKNLINEAIDYYSQNIGNHLFIHEAVNHITVEDIRTIVNSHIAFTGNRPVLIVDYLQLVKNKDPRINANDKMKTDDNLTELKQLSRDYKLPIIVISSFNRANYNSEVKFECFKESGGIDFSCDVIMGLQLSGVGTSDFDVNEAKAKDPREIELVFLKNREAPTGDMIKYYYYPKFNHFSESDEDIKAQREYNEEQAKAAKEQAKANKTELLKIEHLELVNAAFDACQENGSALITDMVDFCGGKPAYKTFERYIKETGRYTVTGNKVIKK